MKRRELANNEWCELPCEKFVRKGSQALTDGELLAILLQTGARGKNVLELSEQVLQKAQVYGPGLSGIHRISLEELQSIDGIGEVKAIKLKTIAEISMRIWRTDALKTFSASSPASIANLFMEAMRHETVEKVILLHLNNKMAVLGEQLLSTGTVNASMLSPREVFISALQKQAVYIILLHNHPSGDPAPSRQDRLITDRIFRFGELVDIRLLDHIIIGDQAYYSFKEQGIFPE